MSNKKRKPGKRKPIVPRIPTMVALHSDSTMDLIQHEALAAFRDHRAQPDHFDVLLDCRAVLLLAASHKKEEGVVAICDLAGMALDNLRERYDSGQRLEATDIEVQTLTVLVEVSEDFWRRTSPILFEAATNALTEARRLRNEQDAAAQSPETPAPAEAESA